MMQIFTLLAALPFLTSAAPVTDLPKRASCAPVAVIFARGTTEAAPIGSVVGPPFESALQSALGSSSLTFTGVDYAASVEGYLEGGDPAGAANMAQMANSAVSSCPSTQLVLSGYSQGAQVTHKAAPELSSQARAAVKAVVLFGDPDDKQPLTGIPESNVDTYCASGDEICAGEPIVSAAHLSYGSDADAAAMFVKGKVSV